MSTQKRQQHPPAFKAKVALEALKERLTVAQIASAYRVHPTQVGVWKRQWVEAAPVAFARPHDPTASAHAALAEELFAKIGRLEMELEWLQKNSSLPPEQLRAMIETDHPQLSVARPCALLGLARSTYYYQPAPVSTEELAVRAALDRAYTRWPFYGSRRLVWVLPQEGFAVGRKRVQGLMRVLGLEAISPKPRLSVPGANVPKYPYLLRGLRIERPNQVGRWTSPMCR